LVNANGPNRSNSLHLYDLLKVAIEANVAAHRTPVAVVEAISRGGNSAA
jgi:hypothetical protein